MEEHVDGPIRSRFRGLSWDKKHQGWRVRIYYSGKQRHVGRFEDDVTAARAYDKAAVYLYGANAITNFPLQDCKNDPTEVSAFIVLAKETADQEQQARIQQRQYGAAFKHQQQLSGGAGSAIPMMLHSSVLSSPQQQQQLFPFLSQQQQIQAAQLPMDTCMTSWQQQQQLTMLGYPSSTAAAAANTAALHLMNSTLQQQQQQQFWGHTGLPQNTVPAAANQVVLVHSPVTPMDTSSNASSITSTTSSTNSGSSSSSYMLCSMPAGQQLVLPVANASAAGFSTAESRGPGSHFMLPLQQQQQQLTSSISAAPAKQQQMLFYNTSQPLQLSVQPQMTTISNHMSAAAAAARDSLQQQLQQFAMSLPMSFTPAGAADMTSPPMMMAHAAPTAGLANAPIALFMNSSNGAATATAQACGSFVDDMLQGLQAYATAAAAAANHTVSPLQQQHQVAAMMLNRPSGSSTAFVDCTSGTCSPILAAPAFQLGPSAVICSQSMQPCSAGMLTSSPTGTTSSGHTAASPTYSSSGSSSSKSFGDTARSLC